MVIKCDTYELDYAFQCGETDEIRRIINKYGNNIIDVQISRNGNRNWGTYSCLLIVKYKKASKKVKNDKSKRIHQAIK